MSSVSTVRLTNHLAATRETVADRIFPVKRKDSRILTQPRLGMRMREPSTLNYDAVSSTAALMLSSNF
jgi:hypothetical protein